MLAATVIAMGSETLGSVIARLRERLGLTQGQLATKADVPREWLSVVELDRIKKPDRERVERLAVALDSPAETLLAMAGYRTKPLPLRERRAPYEIVRELQAALREMPILVPETASPVSAVPGAVADAEVWPYYPKPNERTHDFMAIVVTGDCMEPRLREGERVIVDRSETPGLGDIVLAVHDGETIVNVLEKRGDKCYLVALKNRRPVEVTEHTRIIGVVKMAMHRP